MRVVAICLVLISFNATGWCDSQLMRIGTDQNYWYPFTFVENGVAKGLHVDMANRALTKLGYRVEFIPLPWKRCLQMAREGKLDAVVSASYKPERAEYLLYPPDAAKADRSRWRLTQVEYTVITLNTDPYAFEGDAKTLPSPVRAPLGYSIVDDLRDSGIEVFTASDIHQCLRQLVLSQRGCVVTPVRNARRLNSASPFAGKLKIHSGTMASKSYFIVFSRLTRKLQPSDIQRIWEAIERVRKDKTLMDRLFEKYSAADSLSPQPVRRA